MDSLKILVIIAAGDALVGGFVQGYLQHRGWRQGINDIYQVAAFVLCAIALLKLQVETITVVGIVTGWLCFVEDILYYFWLPLLRPLHGLVFLPHTQRGEPIPMFYLRPYYRGPLGFITRSQWSQRTVLVLSWCWAITWTLVNSING